MFEEKNKTNIITKRESILKNKNTFSQINKEKNINSIGNRKKSFFHLKSKGMENNSNNNNNIQKVSQWSIINDNIKEYGQNLKNPEEFYSAIFSKMIKNNNDDDDK